MNQWLLLSTWALFFTLPHNLFAFTGLSDDTCREKNLQEDLYDVPTRTSEGSDLYSHQCIDTDRFRPVKILSNDDNNLTFANFLHKGKYWVAQVSKNAVVEDLLFQVVRFDVVPGVTAAHTQIRFKMAKGSEFTLTTPNSRMVQKVNDIVISFEASRPKDIPYNFALGAFDNFLMVGRALSGQQRLDESRTNNTEQYQVTLSGEEKKILLLAALQKSNDIQFEKPYNTLRPNCTTEVFDLIDQLPSQAVFNRAPFLTEASLDPIAGPSLKGLKERGVLGNQIAFMHDELLFGKKEAPDESLQQKPVKLMVDIEGAPYSLVVISNTESSNIENIKKAKQLAFQLAPQIVFQVGSSLSKNSASDSLLEGLDQLAPIINKALEKVDGQLTDEPVDVKVYLAPWDGSGVELDLVKELDLKAQLPFKTYEVQNLDQADFLFDGLGMAVAANNKKQSPFGLVSVATHLHLVKGGSKVDFQILGHLGAQEQVLSEPITSDQAEITKFVIPQYFVPVMAPMVLMNLNQKYNDASPDFYLEFGPFRGMNTLGSDMFRTGHFQVAPESCQTESYSTPRMEGEIAIPKLEFLGVWKNTSFHINKVHFDLAAQKAKSVEVNVKPFSVVCLKDEAQAGEQFTDGVNEKLKALKLEALEKGNSLGQTILEKFFSKDLPE